MTIAMQLQQVRCHIVLTNSARNAIKQHFHDEHALFSMQQAFTVYIEKESIENQQIHLTLYFDPEQNKALQQAFPERIVIMDCLFDLKSGLVAKSFRTRGLGTPVATNRREALKIHFVPTRINGHKYHDHFIQTIAKLPISKDRYEYVNKRIMSWEGYLKVLDKNAAIDDIEANYSKPIFSADYRHLTLQLTSVDQKQWKLLKGLSARIRGMHEDLGDVIKVHSQDRLVDIELKPHMSGKVRRNEIDFTTGRIEFSNAATKSQLTRLLRGFTHLKEGLAANPNLETILFEDQPKLRPRKKIESLTFHNDLNEFQRAAVTGAMEAEDLYVIQGPPGTGKTTVISEICTQNVKAGLKTLVASQSNLAVDNALSRLLSNKDIRILRYGRTESIEEDGKKFIEENVATYWKQQTYDAICNEIRIHDHKEAILQEQLTTLQENIQATQSSINETIEKIERKKEAEKQLPVVQEEITQLKKKIVRLKDHQQTIENKLTESVQQLKKAKTNYEQSVSQLGEYDSIEAIQEALSEVNEQIQQLLLEQNAVELYAQLEKSNEKIKQLTEQLQAVESPNHSHQAAIDAVANLKKVAELEAFMEQYQLRRSFVMDRLLTALERLQEQFEHVRSIQPLIERYQKAMHYCRQNLGIVIDDVYLDFDHAYTLESCNEFIELLSKAIATKKITAQNGRRSVEGLHKRYLFLNQSSQQYEAVKQETMIIFKKLKEEVAKQFDDQDATVFEEAMNLKNQVNNEQIRIETIEKQLTAFPIDAIRDKQAVASELTGLRLKKEQLEKVHLIIEPLKQEQRIHLQTIEDVQIGISAFEKEIEKIKLELKNSNNLGLEKEKQVAVLSALINENLEQQLLTYESQLSDYHQQQSTIETEIVLLPMAAEIQQQWKEMLEQASEYDLEEIRKLYVKHSNVIGTTCVASANKQFMDTYPNFDVVIIDEVSKATPPELLLPMLKGKKIILVGDHHQLPPLVGDETFEETLTEVIKDNPSFEQKRELEKLLEESLFERLYKNISSDYKTMLGIQYRMHENIMKTIAPFYKNAQEELQCGLSNSDELRDHKLETSLISRKNHLMWLDIKNTKENYEQRMKEGSSLYNESELKEIAKLLVELNEATAKAIDQGLLPKDTLKSVGVISYYAEQVKRIDRLIESLDLTYLQTRTGSVDKFQGMEMDVILLSMVRNHNGQQDIGFAKDYRRLNVALSRARELLICIGSADMFTKVAKKAETRSMYEHVLNEVKQQDGYRLMEGSKS